MQKRRFITADDGAVTIDWVALAAGLLILGVAIVGLLTGELQSVVDEIEEQLTNATAVEAPSENSGNSYATGAVDEDGNELFAGDDDYFFDSNSDGIPNDGDEFIIVADGVTQEQIDASVASDGNGPDDIAGVYISGSGTGSTGTWTVTGSHYSRIGDVTGAS